jgi:hypothetical protein
MDIKDPSPFRLWVQRIWMENREEHLTFHENPFTIKQYWNEYKYWLKRKYRQQKETK